jgi:hypothetical protein
LVFLFAGDEGWTSSRLLRLAPLAAGLLKRATYPREGATTSLLGCLVNLRSHILDKGATTSSSWLPFTELRLLWAFYYLLSLVLGIIPVLSSFSVEGIVVLVVEGIAVSLVEGIVVSFLEVSLFPIVAFCCLILWSNCCCCLSCGQHPSLWSIPWQTVLQSI